MFSSFSGSEIRSALISRIAILSISSPGAIPTVTDGVRDRWRTSSLSSAAIRSKTGPQTIRSLWRKIRMLGYHGVSSRWLSHRQSGVLEIAIQTGAPAPRPGGPATSRR